MVRKYTNNDIYYAISRLSFVKGEEQNDLVIKLSSVICTENHSIMANVDWPLIGDAILQDDLWPCNYMIIETARQKTFILKRPASYTLQISNSGQSTCSHYNLTFSVH